MGARLSCTFRHDAVDETAMQPIDGPDGESRPSCGAFDKDLAAMKAIKAEMEMERNPAAVAEVYVEESEESDTDERTTKPAHSVKSRPRIIDLQQNKTGGEIDMISSFNQQYEVKNQIGKGGYSVVYEGQRKEDAKRVAIKEAWIKAKEKEAWSSEVAILQTLDHPNIIKFIDHFEPETWQRPNDRKGSKYYLVTELLEGGELFDRIVEKEFYTEKEARDLVRLLLDAILYIHNKGVVHRDLKPENLLLTSRSDDANIKIADFGFAKRVNL